MNKYTPEQLRLMKARAWHAVVIPHEAGVVVIDNSLHRLRVSF